MRTANHHKSYQSHSSLRSSLESYLWLNGCKVAVCPPSKTATLEIFPIELGRVTAATVDNTLEEIQGRLGLESLSGAWLPDGRYSLEIPRLERDVISFKDVAGFRTGYNVPWFLGIDAHNHVVIDDVVAMPHMLIAGTTGAGKSNSITASLSYLVTNRTPQHIQLVLIDPKQVDLTPFASIPHCLTHATKPEQTITTLEALLAEMQHRYDLLARAKARSLAAYNAQATEKLPYIAVIIDELALVVGGKERKTIEPLLLTLLQTARASGIYLIIATQRPNKDTPNPTARANLTARVCYRLPDAASSRIAIDTSTGSSLLGKGDGLYRNAQGNITRFQAPYIDDATLETVLAKADKMPHANYELAQSHQPASHQQPTEQLSSAHTESIDTSGMSQVDRAILLCEKLQWINSTTLVNAGIASSSTVGKGIISELKKTGLIGLYNKQRKAFPVQHINAARDQLRHATDTLNQLDQSKASHSLAVL